MKNKFDVTKIREEVESRKKQQVDHAERSGQPAMAAPTNSMSFLRNLKESVARGDVNSPAIAKMKMVEQKAEQKKPTGLKSSGAGHLDDSMINLISPSNSTPRRPAAPRALNEDAYESSREEAMYRDMERQSQSLRNGSPAVDSLVQEYYGKTQAMPTAYTQPPQIGGGLQLNERAINEEIDKKFSNYINESVNPIMEAAMKNVIIEMYSKERVKKALVEMDLTKMVKEIVIETIKELQARNKK